MFVDNTLIQTEGKLVFVDNTLIQTEGKLVFVDNTLIQTEEIYWLLIIPNAIG